MHSTALATVRYVVLGSRPRFPVQLVRPWPLLRPTGRRSRRGRMIMPVGMLMAGMALLGVMRVGIVLYGAALWLTWVCAVGMTWGLYAAIVWTVGATSRLWQVTHK